MGIRNRFPGGHLEPKPLPQIQACVQGVTIPEHPVDTVEPRRRQPYAPSEPRPRIGREKSLVGRLCGEALAQDEGASERAASPGNVILMRRCTVFDLGDWERGHPG